MSSTATMTETDTLAQGQGYPQQSSHHPRRKSSSDRPPYTTNRRSSSSGSGDFAASSQAAHRRRSSSSSSFYKDPYIDEEDSEEQDDIPFEPPTAGLPTDQEEMAELIAARQSGEHSLGGWHYFPLIIGLAPPLGAILGGGQADHWSDAILLVLSAFWLFQCLKVPHDIYYAARTRRILQQDQLELEEDEQEQEQHHSTEPSLRTRRRQMAIVELQRTEVIALVACIASPIVGAYLLEWLQSNLHDGSRYLNSFNIRLFTMAAGIRPWIHTFKLLRRRLLLLQEDVHYPSVKVESLSRRLKRLEADLSSLRKSSVSHSQVQILRDGLDVPLSTISRHMKKYEKRQDLLRSNSEDKFSLVEARLEDLLRECAINAELIETERLDRERSSSLGRNVLEAFKFAIGQRNTPAHTWQHHHHLQHHHHQVQSSNGNGSTRGLPPIAAATNRPSAHYPIRTRPEKEWYSQGIAYWAFLPLNLSNSLLRYAGGQNNTTDNDRKLIGNSPTSPPTSPPAQATQSLHRYNNTNKGGDAPQLPPLQPSNSNLLNLNLSSSSNNNGNNSSSPWKRSSRQPSK
ncbi:unnamed protein product [Sympodiomycopsis kandeliae]